MRSTSDTTRLRNDLLALVRKRVPACDAEDVVQSALLEALAAKSAPEEHEPFRKFAFGVAKNKIADYYRRSKREVLDDAPDATSPPAAHEGQSLLNWAEDRLPNSESKQTFDWMLREGDGEKLEAIADDEAVPAPRVRKRVSRLREHLRAHWKRELAALAAMGIAGLLFYLLRPSEPEIVKDTPAPSPTLSPELRAEPIRKRALDDCAQGSYQDCIEGLDRARAIDPEGESAPGVARERARAEEALRTPKASPTSGPSLVPTTIPPETQGEKKGELKAAPRPTPMKMGPKDPPAKPTPAPLPSAITPNSGKVSPFSSEVNTPAPPVPKTSNVDGPTSNIVTKSGPPNAPRQTPAPNQAPTAAEQQQQRQAPVMQSPQPDIPAQMKSPAKGGAKR